MKWSSRNSEPMNHADTVTFLLLIAMAIAFVLFVVAIIGAMFSQPTTSARVNLRTATRQAPVTLHSDMPTTRDSVPVVTIYCEVSAYSPTVAETDGNPLITASGKRVYVGGIAADLDVLPFGSIVTIPGYNGGKPCQVVDTGSAIKGNKLDVFLWSTHEAVHFGRRHNVRVEVLYIPKAT